MGRSRRTASRLVGTGARVAAVGLACALVATLVGPAHEVSSAPPDCCATADRTTPPTRADHAIAIIGDSLFVGISSSRYLGGPSLQTILVDSGRVTWSSVLIGQTMGPAVTVVRANRAVIAEMDVALIGLGTNDIHDSGRTAIAEWRASIERLGTELRLINPQIRIVWVDVAFRRLDHRALAFNDILADVARTVADVEICHWRQFSTANPQWLAADGLHLTAAGYRARRDIVLGCLL